MGQSAGSVLVLYCLGPGETLRPAIDSHLRVLTNAQRPHQILYLNAREGIPAVVRMLHFDVVLLHTTLLCARWAWFFEQVASQIAWLRHSSAIKIGLPQDEYDHAHVLDEWLESLGVTVICTNFDERVRADLYPRMHGQARFLQSLTGYIDPTVVADFAGKTLAIKDRPIDVVYRAAHLPYWFGSQGQLKHRIADIVGRRALELGLRTDISTEHAKTITSKYWFDFLGSSKTVIGCESGSSVLDPRGQVQKQIREILAETPGLSFEEVSSRLPRDWESHRYFATGPRHLEAIVTRTCQILVEGEYDGILLPHRHYLPLRRDFANLDEVLAMIHDTTLLEATANRAYDEIVEGGKLSYASFARQLESVFPRDLHPRSPLAWSLVGSLVGCENRFRQLVSPPVSWLTHRAHAGIGLMKRSVKGVLRRVGLRRDQDAGVSS